MIDERNAVLNEVIEDLKHVLAKCDRAGVGASAAIYVDLAVHLATRERGPGFVEAA